MQCYGARTPRRDSEIVPAAPATAYAPFCADGTSGDSSTTAPSSGTGASPSALGQLAGLREIGAIGRARSHARMQARRQARTRACVSACVRACLHAQTHSHSRTRGPATQWHTLTHRCTANMGPRLGPRARAHAIRPNGNLENRRLRLMCSWHWSRCKGGLKQQSAKHAVAMTCLDS